MSLPDQPGSLHALAGACSSVGADIVSLDVIERSGGYAIDDLCVTRIDDPNALRSAISQLPATSIAWVREVDSFRDADGAIAWPRRWWPRAAVPLVCWSAAARCVMGILGGRRRAGLEWARGPGCDTRRAAAGSASWLPLQAPRRLSASNLVRADRTLPRALQLAAAPLAQTTSAVIIARHGGPHFVDRELRQLDLLAQVAVATEVAHTQRRPVERIEARRRDALQS